MSSSRSLMNSSSAHTSTGRRGSDFLGGSSHRGTRATTTGFRAGGGVGGGRRAWASMGLGYVPTEGGGDGGGGGGAGGGGGGGQIARPAGNQRSIVPSAAFGRIRITQRQPQHHNNSSNHDVGAMSSTGGDTSHNNSSSSNNSSLPPSTESSPMLPGSGPFHLNNNNSKELDGGPSAAFQRSLTAVAAVLPPWWIIPSLVCAMFYATYNLCIKIGSEFIHPVLGGVILQFVAALVGAVLLAFLVWQGGATTAGGIDYIACLDDMVYDPAGIRWAVWAGISVGAAEVLSFSVSGLGVPASRSIPIIVGGSVVFGTVMGCVLLKEELSIRGWIGVVLIVLGITLLATDPGHQLSDE